MRRFARSAVAAAVLAMSVVLMAATSAHAANQHGQCEGDGDTLFGTVYYDYQGGNTVYVERVSLTIQDNGGDQNNAYIRLRGNGGDTTYWAWTSGDDLVGGQTYQFIVDEIVPRGSNPYVKFHGTFDQYGPDPSCQFYIHL
jgi:hypothetical protein